MTATGGEVVDEGFRLGHRPALDGIRGLGMLLVIIFHSMTYLVDWYGPYGESVLPGAPVAVDVFFALSGFLITSLLLEERRRSGDVSMRNFYIRRGLRLLPVFYVVLALFCVYVAVSDDVGFRTYASSVLKMLTYSSNFFIADDRFLTQWFGQTWSLAIEEQFYIVWPVILVALMAFFRRRPLVIVGLLLTAVLAVVAWRLVLWDQKQLWSDLYYRSDTRIDQPLAGAMLAVMMHFGIVSNRPRPWIGALGLAGWGWITLISSPFQNDYYQVHAPAMLAVSLMVILGVLHAQGPAYHVLAFRPLRWMGRISYTLYIVHVAIYFAVSKHMDGQGDNIQRVVVANVLAFAATVVLHHLVEAPALRLKDRWAPTRIPRRPAVAAADV
jgi:peptidoglycan/LPS O-acetylase OafA/YrhL